MSFATDKACALDKIRAFNCDYVQWVDDNLNSYDDIIPSFLAFLPKFECFPDYTYSLFECFEDSALTARGIYYDKTETTLTDPTLIIKTTATDITLNISTGSGTGEFVIFGNSIVNSVTVDGGGTLVCLSVSAGANLKYLTTTAGSTISLMRVSGCRTFLSRVDIANSTSIIDNIFVFGGGYFGGYNCADPTSNCASDISVLISEKITQNSITLKWTPAEDTLYTIVYYKLNNTGPWLMGSVNNDDGITGSYTVDSLGYIFRGLQMDTYYDFKVVNVCTNGQPSSGVTLTVSTT